MLSMIDKASLERELCLCEAWLNACIACKAPDDTIAILKGRAEDIRNKLEKLQGND